MSFLISSTKILGLYNPHITQILPQNTRGDISQLISKSLMNMDTKILKKILVNLIQEKIYIRLYILYIA